MSESQRVKAVWQHTEHKYPSKNLDIHALHPTLHFVGHYDEPPIKLDVDLTRGGKDIRIAFDPLAGQWSVDAVSCTEETRHCCVDRDCEYGLAHRRYVVQKRIGQGIADTEKQVEQEFQQSRRMAEDWANEEARGRARDRAGLILKNHKQVRKILEAGRST